jgi:hypothetical protein
MTSIGCIGESRQEERKGGKRREKEGKGGKRREGERHDVTCTEVPRRRDKLVERGKEGKNGAMRRAATVTGVPSKWNENRRYMVARKRV